MRGASKSARSASVRDADRIPTILQAAGADQPLSVVFTPQDTGNYNSFWLVERELDERTSLVIDPPDGRIPPMKPEAMKRLGASFGGALVVTTTGCRDHCERDQTNHESFHSTLSSRDGGR